MTTPKLLKILLLQVAVVAALAVGYLAWDSDALYEWLSGDVTFTPPKLPCDLHTGSCEATLIDGTALSFSVTPRPIPVMQKLQFTVHADALKQSELTVEFYGLNMNMGRYRYHLERGDDGVYRGEGMIPSCVAEMEWRANIIAESPTKRIGTYFTFMTE